MTDVYYNLFIKSVLKLAATILIKSARTATLLNTKVTALGYSVNQNDPTTWKYYLNMAGEYHPYDTPMEVMSLDTREIITFTKENLAIHLATKSAYTYGTDLYNELISTYPNQRALINGILNPIDIEVAIDAADHTILFYDTSLVEVQEQFLIPKLQTYIDRYFYQKFNVDYTLFEPFYYPGLLGVLYTLLPITILNLRKEACKTDHAHSFYIRMYLKSFSQVGSEFDYMPTKLRLWLYRNIRYINRNIGHDTLLQDVTKHVLTDQGFNLSGYQLKQTYTSVIENLTPDITVERQVLNGIEAPIGKNTKTIGEVLDLELPMAKYNPIYRDDDEVDIRHATTTSLYGSHITKVLESATIDYTDADPYTLVDVLLNHWIYLGFYNRYKSILSITDPVTGKVYNLNARDAFTLYLYCYSKSVGFTLEVIPKVRANRVRRQPLPGFTELRSLATTDLVPDYLINYFISKQPEITDYISIKSFNSFCVNIHDRMTEERYTSAFSTDWRHGGALQPITDRFYQDIRINLAKGLSSDKYVDWFTTKGIDLTGTDYGTLATLIYKTAVGASTQGYSTREIHASMLRIMVELSSYSVQFVGIVNDSAIKVSTTPYPLISLPNYDETTDALIDIVYPTVMALPAVSTSSIDVDVSIKLKMGSIATESSIHVPVDPIITTTRAEDAIAYLNPPVPLLVEIPTVLTILPETTSVFLDQYKPNPVDLPSVFTTDTYPTMTGGYDALTLGGGTWYLQ